MKLRLFICCLVFFWSASGATAELSHFVTVKVLQAQKQASDHHFTKAIQTLESLKLSKAYDKAWIARMLGVYYWQNDQPETAIQKLSDAVTYSVFQHEELWSLQHMLADLLANQGHYQKALTYYEHLLTSAPKGTKLSDLWLRIAQLHYQLAQWEKVLTAIKHFDSFGLPDAVAPLSVLLGAQVQLRRYSPAVRTVKRLLVLEPDKQDWWLQLTGLELKLNRKKSALATLELARLQGVPFSDSNLRLLGQLYAQNGIPERAARIFEQLYQHSRSASQIAQIAYYWQEAKEWDKARQKWKLAATYQPRYYLQVARIEIQQGMYQQALQSLNAFPAQEKEARIALMKAVAFYKLNHLESALVQARKANDLEPSGQTKNWVKYLTQLHRYQQHPDI